MGNKKKKWMIGLAVFLLVMLALTIISRSVYAYYLPLVETTTVQEKYDRLIAQGAFPIARWGTAEDVANAVSLLCSDQLAYTTGNYLDVDGGFHIRVL